MEKELSKQWDDIFDNEPRGLDRIIHLIEICKDTIGEDWEYNKTRLHEIIEQYIKQQSKKEAIAFLNEIERLKGLIEKLYKDYFGTDVRDKESRDFIETEWQQFKNKNNL